MVLEWPVTSYQAQWWSVFTAACLVLLGISGYRRRYYAKVAWVLFIELFLSGFISLPFLVLYGSDVRNSRGIAIAKDFLYRLIGMRVEVENGEVLHGDRPAVIMFNHQSLIDMRVLSLLRPSRGTCLVKAPLRYLGLLGVQLVAYDAIFVQKGSNGSSRDMMTKAALKIKDQKVQVLAFPEGTRAMKGEIGPFKKGVFHLAIQAKADIIPVVISDYRSFYDPTRRIFESGVVKVKCHAPISTAGATADDLDRLMQETRDVMHTSYQCVSEETRRRNAHLGLVAVI